MAYSFMMGKEIPDSEPEPGATDGGLEHLDVKAASTVTDQGRFSASSG